MLFKKLLPPAAVVVATTLVAGCAPTPSSTTSSAAAEAVSSAASEPLVPESEILAQVASASSITSVPGDMVPSIANAKDQGAVNCQATALGPSNYCISGDTSSEKSIVVYGDSHAAEWTYALDPIAKRNGYKLVRFSLPGCPAPDLTFYSYAKKAANTDCDTWHQVAPAKIVEMKPTITIVTSSGTNPLGGDGKSITSEQWQSGLSATLTALQPSGSKIFVLGDYSYLPQAAPDCLAAHMSSVQDCSASLASQTSNSKRDQEKAAADAAGVPFINTLPWTCSDVCSPIIGKFLAYKDEYHLSAPYTAQLAGVLSVALGLPTS